MIHKQQFNQSYFVRPIVVPLCYLGVNAAAVFSNDVLRRNVICDEVIHVKVACIKDTDTTICTII